MENTTDKLFEMIETDPEKFLSGVGSTDFKDEQELFIEFLLRAMDEKYMNPKRLSLMTGISQSHMYQITSGAKRSGRDNTILMAIALGLDLAGTQRLLKLSENAPLYPRVKRDAILIACIECGLGIEETDRKLVENSEKRIWTSL
ncbi:MAG: hypothetical protein NC084_06635 [Bacteroides sp.]|nr:hypothetical protein [Eubacterium sp.]MCM1418243.1 hypothetical protein [Roseburia sp.]MCM1462375.1 hypothetical protein [Bacteroides sp.]